MSEGTFLQWCRDQIDQRIKDKGWPPGLYQAIWRGIVGTPDNWYWAGQPIEKFNRDDCMLAVLDALCNQGSISAWAGDGTECVVQMIELAYKDRDKYKMELEELKNEIQRASNK